MKIAHIIFSLTIGGTENMLADIANEQALDNDVSVIIINDIVDSLMESCFSSRVKVSKIGRKPKSIFNAISLVSVYFLLYKIRPKLIHLHNYTAIPLFPRLLVPNNSRIIYTVHDTGITIPPNKSVDVYCSISRAVQDDLLIRQGISSVLVENGIVFPSVKQRASWSITDSFRIVQVSRLDFKKKGQDILIDAVCRVKERFPHLSIEVTFIGDGPSREALEQQSVDLGISNSFIFLGAKEKKYVYEKLCEYHCLVQPSRYEGFGLTVAEGMAAKIPVIVSDIEGPMEVIDNGKLGVPFCSDNSEDLSDKICQIISEYGQSSFIEMIEKAADHVEEKYSIARVASQYVSFANIEKV